jgi:hypothetical protein
MTKPRFQIGQWVRVLATVYFYYDNDNVRKYEIYPTKRLIEGQIVGASRRFLGTYKGGHQPTHGFSLDDDPPDFEPAYLAVNGSVVVWRVLEGYLNKPIEAFGPNIEVIDDLHRHCVRFDNAKDRVLPWQKQNWDPTIKRDMREMAKELPRDEKGRWK